MIKCLLDTFPKDGWVGGGALYLTPLTQGLLSSNPSILILKFILNRNGTVGSRLAVVLTSVSFGSITKKLHALGHT